MHAVCYFHSLLSPGGKRYFQPLLVWCTLVLLCFHCSLPNNVSRLVKPNPPAGLWWLTHVCLCSLSWRTTSWPSPTTLPPWRTLHSSSRPRTGWSWSFLSWASSVWFVPHLTKCQTHFVLDAPSDCVLLIASSKSSWVLFIKFKCRLLMRICARTTDLINALLCFLPQGRCSRHQTWILSSSSSSCSIRRSQSTGC